MRILGTMTDTTNADKITLSPAAYRVADEIRALAGLSSVEDAILVALGDELYFRKKVHEGYRVIVNRGDDCREVDLATTE